MKNHYRISLQILQQLLMESDNTHWAHWIAEDIRLWDTDKSVQHHLGAYGGMGSINDLAVGGTDQEGIWKNHVFDMVKNLAWHLAHNGGSTPLTASSFYSSERPQLHGRRCRVCGYSRIDENQIDGLIASEQLPHIIAQLVQRDALEELLPVPRWINAPAIQYKRTLLVEALQRAAIDVEPFGEWTKGCLQCKSAYISPFSWEFNSETAAVIEIDDRQEIGTGKEQNALPAEATQGLLATLKRWFLQR